MKSPIRVAREEMKVTIREFAILAGTTEQTVRANERGDTVKITAKLLDFLVKHGSNREELKKEQEKFRKWKKDQLLQRLNA